MKILRDFDVMAPLGFWGSWIVDMWFRSYKILGYHIYMVFFLDLKLMFILSQIFQKI